MKRIMVLKVAALASAAVCVGLPAFAMPIASGDPGYQAGAELGANLDNGVRFAGAADFNTGLKTNFAGIKYTTLFADFLSGGGDWSANLWTVGLRQQLPLGGAVPIAVEGGLSYLNNAGGFVGSRATFFQSGKSAISGMVRYHFEDGGFWQLGAGYTAPVGKSTGLFYQADYYHLTGLNSDTIMLGVRWSGGR